MPPFDNPPFPLRRQPPTQSGVLMASGSAARIEASLDLFIRSGYGPGIRATPSMGGGGETSACLSCLESGNSISRSAWPRASAERTCWSGSQGDEKCRLHWDAASTDLNLAHRLRAGTRTCLRPGIWFYHTARWCVCVLVPSALRVVESVEPVPYLHCTPSSLSHLPHLFSPISQSA